MGDAVEDVIRHDDHRIGDRGGAQRHIGIDQRNICASGRIEVCEIHDACI